MPKFGSDYGNFSPADSRAVAFAVADDGDIAFLVRYTGSEDSATVEVEAGGNILFKIGDVGSEAADTNVSTDGTIAVSGASEDTLGEVVDLLNATSDWEAVIVDGVYSDSVNNTLLDSGPSQAKTPEGLQMKWDTSATFDISRLIAPDYLRTDIRPYLVDGVVTQMYPFKGTRAGVQYLAGLSTYASGTSTFQLITDTGLSGGSQIFFSKAGGATATDGEAISAVNVELVGNRSERVVARLNNSAAMSSAQLRGNGRLFRSLA